MPHAHLLSLSLFVASASLSTMASAQAIDPEEDLADAYAQACDDSDAACLDASSTATNAVRVALQAPTRAKHDGASAGLSTPIVSALVRRPLTGDVVEYAIDVMVGPGPYDHIGLHRVVRENAPYVPRSNAKSVMLVHGDIWDFQGAFLANGGEPESASVAVYLAQQNIDVWGVDLGWTKVSAQETDLAFMADWGFSRDTRDIGVALGIARRVRALTGNGFGKMNLLGWSRGGQLGYAYLDGESQLPLGLRNVSGFIPVDVYLKTNVEQQRVDACSRLAMANGALQNGVYANDTGNNVSPLGFLAQVAPSDTTPVPSFQPLTNAQVADLLGAATFLIANPPPVPTYHLAGGSFDANFQVTGLAYESSARWYDLVAKGKPYQPWRQIADAEISICDDSGLGDVTFDDHLSSIQVPVLYVGAGGGFGADGVYTTTLLGSTDVTTHIVQFFPTEARILDIGHADIFQGTNAESLFWVNIKDWINAH